MFQCCVSGMPRTFCKKKIKKQYGEQIGFVVMFCTDRSAGKQNSDIFTE